MIRPVPSLAPGARARQLARRSAYTLAMLATAIVLVSPTAIAQTHRVLVANLTGEIVGPTVDFVAEAIDAAESGGYAALVLRLDTPGGALLETFDIVERIFTTRLPVIGYVAPAGAHAFSAGTIILESTDLAAMAPGTTIGSVQPVVIGPSGFEPVTEPKIVNAIVEALNESLSRQGRNVSLARSFVVDNLNLGPTAAKDAGAIEVVASTLMDMLAQADGRTTKLKGLTLSTAGAAVVEFSPSLRNLVIALLSNPLASSILLILGIYAFIFRLSAPGHGAEFLGIFLIVLALIGLGFSVSPLALLLIVLGVAFLIVELKKPGFGVFGVAGIVAIVIGAFFLAPLRPPEFAVSADYQLTFLAALLTPAAAFGGFILFALYKVAEVRRRKPVIGPIVGQEAEAIDPISPEAQGYVRHRAEMWLATAREAIAPGERVVIEAKDGPLLTVRRKA